MFLDSLYFSLSVYLIRSILISNLLKSERDTNPMLCHESRGYLIHSL